MGVLSNVKTVFTNHVGLRDEGTGGRPDADIIYALCSNSKTFFVACLGLLVEQGKVKRADRVGYHLSTFRPKDDHSIAEQAALNDLLRHSSGIANPVATFFGPNGKLLVPQKNLIDVVNQTPTKNLEGEKKLEVQQYCLWVVDTRH